MKLGFNSTLNVEASIVDDAGAAGPLAGQVFYILEKSPDDLLKGSDVTSEIWYARTMNALRNHAFTFFITDSQGKAEIKVLKAGTYYICGIGHTQRGVVIWNVPVELRSAKNSLILDNRNQCR
jgi:hypothetical protein